MWLLVVLHKAILHYHTAEHGSQRTALLYPAFTTQHCQITATGAVSYRLQNRGREKTDLEHIECVSGERAKREPMERERSMGESKRQQRAKQSCLGGFRVLSSQAPSGQLEEFLIK